ncbi:Uncharacterized protein C19orf43 [Mizuhopecten yessoensis]|uniref:Uncharacterized protein C19orf43 n=1 Tax=Mizuhopecten yessoensis TaxID=6573 RepID=A0A210PNS6_MIZYE|nr:Uncharacterized protein C19orf43 [Mizuhopecten yessoensis]
MAAERGTRFSPAKIFTGNKFSNDGSFLEMFKKHMEEKDELNSNTTKESDSSNVDKSSSSSVGQETSDSTATDKKPVVLPIVGKRKGANRALKTGIVAKKPKPEKKEESDGSAWSKYLAEVNEYKSKMCMDEDKSRPLVK